MIHHKDSKPTGTFTLEENGVEMGKLHYSWAGIDKFIITHTEVYPAYEGQGRGEALVNAAVDFARSKKFQIIPKCSFAKSLFKEHDGWKDVLFQV